MSSKKSLICYKHDDILELCNEILQMNFDKRFKTRLIRKIKQIKQITEEALKDGQRMEDRLKEYYYAIEELGFVRNNKK